MIEQESPVSLFAEQRCPGHPLVETQSRCSRDSVSHVYVCILRSKTVELVGKLAKQKLQVQTFLRFLVRKTINVIGGKMVEG